MAGGKKPCTCCEQILPLSCFYREPRIRNGLKSWCKNCTRLESVKHYQKNRKKRIAQQGAYQKANPKKRRITEERWRQKLIAEIQDLLGNKCTCCGSTERLELDHIEPQTKSYTRKKVGMASYRDARKNGTAGYQLLCRQCNIWKNDGPFCPCKHWDEKSPGWREAMP